MIRGEQRGKLSTIAPRRSRPPTRAGLPCAAACCLRGGNKGHQYGQCPHKMQKKTKGGRTALAEIAEDVSEGQGKVHVTR